MSSARLKKLQIPRELLEDPVLNKSIESLPSNYNFEIHKTIWKIKQGNIQKVALQFPEGLMIYANTIADILEDYTDADVMVMGDVVYGACCVDDIMARCMGAQLLVHYGHSCLVPISLTPDIQMLYVFVDIRIDCLHFINTIKKNFSPHSHLTLVSTVQFVTTLQQVAEELKEHFKVTLPQSKPLSPGEILGCTSAVLPSDADCVIYLGDGRFHIESIMIHNPSIPAYKYDPYSKIFTRETYEHETMKMTRKNEIDKASRGSTFGVVMGTLGRQGSARVVETVVRKLREAGKRVVVHLMAELHPLKLAKFPHVDAWVQIACPRLSIDWGNTYHKPLLTPYEVNVLLEKVAFREVYPMDFYAYDGLGDWTVNFGKNRNKKTAILSS